MTDNKPHIVSLTFYVDATLPFREVLPPPAVSLIRQI
jgi:hypothetical protein